MKKRILIVLETVVIMGMTFYVVSNCNSSASSRMSIPVEDIATMEVNDDGYYQLTIKDITYINDNKHNTSYEDIMKEVNR
jgi:hypothetical protein